MNKNSNEIPSELRELIKNMDVDFIVKSKKRYLWISSFGRLTLGLIFLGSGAFIYYFIVGKIFLPPITEGICTGECIWDRILEFAMVIGLGLFALVSGFFLTKNSVFRFFKKGDFFVGTDKALIQYNNDFINSTPWTQFSGGSSTYQNDSLILVVKKERESHKVGRRIYLIGIPDLMKIKKNCLDRIFKAI